MKLTAIKDDNIVQIDGVAVNAEFTIPDNIHAIAWDGSEGHIEYKDGQPNTVITDFGDWEYLVDEFNAFKSQQEADRTAELQAIEDALTYADLRSREYPSIQDQLDMQYWDSVNGTTTWADAIAKVKADYPKGGE